MIWFLLPAAFVVGIISGSYLTLLRYKSLGISHPKRIETRLKLGLSVSAASTIKNKYLGGFK